jgi:hypothetical protein
MRRVVKEYSASDIGNPLSINRLADAPGRRKEPLPPKERWRPKHEMVAWVKLLLDLLARNGCRNVWETVVL